MYGYTTFHEKTMNTLIESVHNGTNAHAYIFDGPKGLMKHSSAKLFAAALTCLGKGSQPCGTCRSCIESKADTNPDVLHIMREKENGKLKKTIGIEPIRNAVKDAQIKPFNAPRKVYIIDEGDLMTPEAQNAFLKTLEEPPEYAVFIIVTENSSSLLQTVLSRAVLIQFHPVSDEITRNYILQKYPDIGDRLDFVVKYCAGVPGEADRIMEWENFEELRQKSLEELPRILSPQISEAFNVQDFVTENKDDTDAIFDFWISYLRDIAIMQCGVRKNIINSDKSEALLKISGKTDERTVMTAVRELMILKDMLSRSVKQSAAVLRFALAVKQSIKR